MHEKVKTDKKRERMNTEKDGEVNEKKRRERGEERGRGKRTLKQS